MAPQGQVAASSFSEDILAFITLLAKHGVAYVIVGGEAVIYHGHPRFTGDIDFFYDRTEANARRLFACLEEFWNGSIPEVAAVADLLEEGVVVQFGRPPHRLVFLNRIDGLTFADAWQSREAVGITGGDKTARAFYLGKEALIQNKKAAGRPKDLDDAQNLEASG